MLRQRGPGGGGGGRGGRPKNVPRPPPDPWILKSIAPRTCSEAVASMRGDVAQIPGSAPPVLQMRDKCRRQLRQTFGELLHAWKWQSTQRQAAPAQASARGYRNHLAGPSLQCVNVAEYVKPRLTAAVECPLLEKEAQKYVLPKTGGFRGVKLKILAPTRS